MNKWFPRLAAAAAAAAGVWALAAPAVLAQTSQPVRIIAGYAPGGNVDILARTFARTLSELLGRQVIVENKPGGGGQVAAGAVNQAVRGNRT